MSVRYWEIKGDPEGRRFCFTTEPLYECPFGGGAPAWMVDAAEDEGFDPEQIVRIWRRGHGSLSGSVRQRNDAGRLTDRCSGCGYKLDSHGYSAYVERPKRPEEYRDTDATSAAISERLGGHGPTVRLKGQNGLKRSEARKWAYEQFLQAKAELMEVAR
jgi:hypothetical protein